MPLSKSLVQVLKPIKEEIEAQIKESIEMGDDPDSASYVFEQGVILTQNQAKRILELIEFEGI